MVCSNCEKETKGVKLNGNIYCTFCGELIEEGPKKEAKPGKDNFEVSPPVAKIIGKDGEETTEDLNLLEAEEEVLEIIEDKSSPKKNIRVGKANVVRSGRKRVDHHGLDVLPNEPDPIAEPELQSPEDVLVTERKEAVNPVTDSPDNDYPLLDKEHREELEKKNKTRQSFLNAYLKEGTKGISTEQKRKPKKRKSHKVFWTVFITSVVLVSGFIGLIIYVNYFATEPANIESSLVENTNFDYTEPGYITPGYELSYLSKSDEDKVEYVYVSQLDEASTVVVRAQKDTTQNADIYELYIEGRSTDYSSILVGGLVAWIVDNNSIYLLKDGVIYEVSSDSVGKAELIKMAEGIALGN